MDTREFHGLQLAATADIKLVNNRHWLVPSQTGRGSYRVDLEATCCTCEDFELTAQPCKHVFAVRFVRSRIRFQPVPAMPSVDTPDNPPPKKPTYRQNWPAYNAAQTAEKRLFLPMLADLCGTIPEPEPKPGRGRKPVSLRDSFFAAVFKVYSGFSARRFMSDLDDAQAKGHIEQAPCFNHVLRVLDRDDAGPILQSLVARSSLPLRAVENDFAVDSSGFGTSKFETWMDKKYGVTRRRAVWMKTHICIGVKTQVVTAVEISDRHDGQAYPDLVQQTGERFTLRDVVADKAYLSRENLEFTCGLGATPYIPFKINNRPDRNGETWERLFHTFALRRDDFLRHYHQRSNVETAFSMVKRLFGDSIRSKTPAAMANEVLCKLVCHNLVVLIHEMHELGIDPGLGGVRPDTDDGDGDEPRIIRFPSA